MNGLTSDEVASIWAQINEVYGALESLAGPGAAMVGAERIPHERLGAWIHRDSEQRCAVLRSIEERRAVLRQELKELQAQLPPTGEASGNAPCDRQHARHLLCACERARVCRGCQCPHR